VELVSGVAVGAVIGYAIDSGLDSFPLFFLICFLLGTAAGILNMMRSVNRELSKHDNIQDKT
jgi:ATP synthase protein I